jgi:hypothetical protein
MSESRDPIWQTILYIWLNPYFRALHYDKHYFLCNFTLFVSIYFKIYPLVLISILSIAIKYFITCGKCKSPYKDRSFRNSRLDCRENIPVLILYGSVPYDIGYDYGILMCDEILFLINRFETIVKPKVKPHILKTLDDNLPEYMKQEIKGMVDAINSIHPYSITYNDILTIQMVPELDNMSCTCYANKDSEGNVIFGRNMDWLPFSSAQYSFVVHYEYYNYKSLVVPGLIGCVTSWKNNFALAMNVVGGDDNLNTNNLPSMLFNKKLMMESESFEKAIEFAEKNRPMTSYNLTLASVEDVHSFSYKTNGRLHVRKLSMRDKNLAVLNWTYPENNEGCYISKYRDNLTKNRSETGIRHVKEILRGCQTFETMHTLIFDFNREPYISIGNGFSADGI